MTGKSVDDPESLVEARMKTKSTRSSASTLLQLRARPACDSSSSLFHCNRSK